MNIGKMILTGKTSTWRKSCVTTTCPPKIFNRCTWYRT